MSSLQDNFKREINYLRVSVTDRCNLRCVYCMPEEGVKATSHEEILTLEEIVTIIKAATGVGIKRIRLTGGEPLVRLGITNLIHDIAQISQIDDISITTNGILYGDMAEELKQAGLKRVNISLDSMKPARFKEITRHDCLSKVFDGINRALSLGMHPVKINTVAIRGVNDDEIGDFARLTMDQPLHLRFIELMPIGTCNPWAVDNFMPAEEIRQRIEERYGPLREEEVFGGGPAKYFRLPGAEGTIGFITAISNHFCNSCNRLRLTANGYLRPCLYDHREYPLKPYVRGAAAEAELAQQISKIITLKPDRHHMGEGWHDQRVMSQIGG